MMLDPVTRAVFHPRSENYPYVPKGMPTLTISKGAEIADYLHRCQNSTALLIFFHGNGEIAADYDAFAELYTQCGVSCWVIDYRGYGRSTGTPSFSALFRDAEAVLSDVDRVAAAAGLLVDHVLVMGRSLGSAPALHLAASSSSSLSGLILDSPYADGLALITRLGGPRLSRQDLPNFEDNIDLMTRCQIPTLIIHGTADSIIPLTEAEALLNACPSTHKQLLKIPGGGHNTLLLMGLPAYCQSLKALISRVVASSPASSE